MRNTLRFLTVIFLLPASFIAAQTFTRVDSAIPNIATDIAVSLGSNWVDYDGDGYLDLFVVNPNEPNYLYRNDGAPAFTFTRVTNSAIAMDDSPARGSTWGDIDNDGDLDVFMAIQSSGNNILYLNEGDADGSGEILFTPVTDQRITSDGGNSEGSSWGDFDNDGDLDLFVVNREGNDNFLYKNRGAGIFDKITAGVIVNDGGWSESVSWADYDNDGHLDLFVINGAEGNPFLYQNLGDDFIRVDAGVLTDMIENDVSSSWGDYDNDGDLDLFLVTELGNLNSLLFDNNGDGTFTSNVTAGPIVNDILHSHGSSWGDYDNDGDLDMFVANLGASSLYENTGAGFVETLNGMISWGSSDTGIWGDYDKDGDLDLFVSNSGDGAERNALYRNNGNDNGWINIRCVGTASNFSAIGARVSLKAKIGNLSFWQIREISAQTGHNSQNSLNVHFGLGDATIIDSLRIRWPSGTIQELSDVGVNQFLDILEPQFVRITTGAIATDTGRSLGVSWGDYDNDGYPDLFVTNSSRENNFLYRNNKAGGFEKITTGAMVDDGGFSESANWGDYDNDGDLDLFVANLVGDNFLYKNDGDRTFEKIDQGDVTIDGGNSKGSAWGDYDQDGYLDLFVANTGNQNNNFLYHNEGSTGFVKITTGDIVNDGGHSQGCSWVDYDNDGDLDLYVINLGSNFLYQNNGDGSFMRITSTAIVDQSESFLGSSWADYDNDGDLDVLVTNSDPGVRDNILYRNDPDPIQAGQVQFEPVHFFAAPNASGSSWGDLDNDGDLDLFIASQNDDDNVLYRNNGDDTFTRITVGPIVSDGGNSVGAAWADYDHDGALDLFVANNNQPNFLYKTTKTKNHWLNIHLKGRTANAAAIGARVHVTSIIDGDRVTQMRELSTQTGYLSQNSLNAHFGLSDKTVADSIRVVWPSGAVNRYFNVAADQFLVYQENNRPRAENTIPTITLSTDEPEFTQDLSASPAVYFDSDGDALNFSVTSTDTSIVAAFISGSQLTVSLRDERAAGNVTIELTADDGRVDDGRGETELVMFEVNRPPLLFSEISDKIFAPGISTSFVEDLGKVFLDPDVGSDLIFRVMNPDSSIATTHLDDRILTISRGDSSGQVEITVEANDSRGGRVTTEFSVRNVSSNIAPRLITSALPDTTLILGGDPLRQNLKALFVDDDGDELMFTASSSPPLVAFAGIEDDTLLVVVPLTLGEAMITIRALDGIGGETPTSFNVEVLRSFRPVISHTATATLSVGQGVAITADITDDEGALANAHLSYRVSGDASFQSEPMDIAAIDANTFRVTSSIPSLAVTDRGVEYFIVASDTHAVQARVPPTGILSVRVRVEGEGIIKANVQPSGNEQTSYRLISIPIDVDDKNPEAVLGDDLGPYDPTQWRLYQWGALPTGGVTKSEFPDVSPMSPGIAFWLIVKNAGKSFDSGPGTTVSTAERYPIPLSTGWNLVANPFNFPTVAEENTSNGRPVALYSFDGVWSDALDPSAAELQPFEGYALFSFSPDTLFIKANPFDSGNILSKRVARNDTEPLWSIRIRARCQSARDENNILAVAPGALQGWDILDSPEPPGIGEYVSVYFPHPEWDRLNQRFSTDFRPELFEGDEWEFEVESNIQDVVNLSFDGLEHVPAEYEIWVVDKALNMTIDLRGKNSYSIAGGNAGRPKQLALLVGRSGYVDDQLAEFRIVPTNYELFQNFPNPFNPVTTIQYGLPTSNRVTLEVYNLLGEKVMTLIDDELQDAGYHITTWGGRNAAGLSVASGIYFLRLRSIDPSSNSAAPFVQIRKMVLIE